MKKFSFWILLAIAVFIVVGGANSQTKIPGSRIQDGAIDTNHFSDNVMALVVFEGDTVAMAFAVVNGVLTLTDLNTASRDSLKRTFVEYSDSAGVALFLSKDALNDTLQIKSNIRDGIFGRGATPWVYKAQFATESDSSGLSDYAREAGIADSARTAPVNDYALYAERAGVADIALVAISSDTSVGDSTVNWDALTDLVQAAIKTDSVQLAKRADSLSANAIDSYGMFDATMKSSYIPTNNEKLSLGQTITGGAALSATNPVVDSTGLYSNFPVNLDGASKPLWFSFHNDADSVGATGKSYFLIDTVGLGFTITDLSGTRFAIEDSAAIRALFSTLYSDSLTKFIRHNTTSGFPVTITVHAATPSGGIDGDLWVNTQDSTLSVKIAGTWDPISGGGGGGGPASSVSTATWGTIDADSLIPNVSSESEVPVTSHLVFTNGAEMTNGSTLALQNKTTFDSIAATAGKFIRVVEDDTIGGRYIIGSVNVTKQPDIYAQDFTATGSVDLGAVVDIGTMTPNDINRTIGTGTSSSQQFQGLYTNRIYGSYNADQGYPQGQIDNGGASSIVWNFSAGGGIYTATDVNYTITGGDLSVTTGSISSPTLTAYNGPYLNGFGLFLTSGDYMQVPSTSTIRLESGGEILLKDDSIGFADLDNTAIKYHLVEDSIWAAGIAACPDPAATNPVITKNWFGEWLANQYRNIDTLYAYKWNARKFHYYKHPLCDDSLYFNGQDNVHIVWPTVPGTPIEFPDTAQQIILPWITPGVPIGPYWIDSTSNGFLFSDDGAGMPEHHIQVSERFDSKFGSITGKYNTLKQAVDSLFNLRVRLDSCITSDASGGTFRLTPNSPHVGNELRIYRGEALVKSAVRDTIPRFLKKQGVFAKFRHSGDEEGRWVEIQSWQSDSTFTVKDSVLGGYFTSVSALDSVWDITLAIKTTIEILPPVKGGHVIIDSTITINDECPIRIKGTDKNEVILSNFDGTVTKCLPMFNVKSIASYDTCYTGMPIEFSDMTIYGDTLGSSSEPIIRTAGNTKLENMNIASTIIGTSKGAIQHEYYKGQYVRGGTPFIVLENVTVVLETNGVVVGIVGDSTDFQSYNSVYSISGDSGCVLLLHDNNWPNSATHNPPQFFGDQFFFGTSTARLAGTWSSQAWDSVSVVQSHFIGVDGVTSDGSGVLKGDLNNIIPGGNNSYSSDMIQPPAKLKALPVKATYIPKK